MIPRAYTRQRRGRPSWPWPRWPRVNWRSKAIRVCVICGGKTIRGMRLRTIPHQRRRYVIQQHAWWCRRCGFPTIDGGDAARATAALRAAVENDR